MEHEEDTFDQDRYLCDLFPEEEDPLLTEALAFEPHWRRLARVPRRPDQHTPDDDDQRQRCRLTRTSPLPSSPPLETPAVGSTTPPLAPPPPPASKDLTPAAAASAVSPDSGGETRTTAHDGAGSDRAELAASRDASDDGIGDDGSTLGGTNHRAAERREGFSREDNEDGVCNAGRGGERGGGCGEGALNGADGACAEPGRGSLEREDSQGGVSNADGSGGGGGREGAERPHDGGAFDGFTEEEQEQMR